MAEQKKYDKPDYASMPEADEVAIWKRKSKSGKQYFSGILKVEGVSFKFVAFPNERHVEGGNMPILSYIKPEVKDQYKSSSSNGSINHPQASGTQQSNDSDGGIDIEVPF